MLFRASAPVCRLAHTSANVRGRTDRAARNAQGACMRKTGFSPTGAVLASFLAATLWLAGGSQLAEADLLALPVAAPPSSMAPDVLLRTVTADVLAILKRDAEAGDATKITELVEAKILPFFDFAQMTRIAMGRNWSAASPEQQSALVAQFRTLLVRTYSMSLASYRDQVVEYLPLHARAGDTDVTVRSTVKRPGAERMTTWRRPARDGRSTTSRSRA
jgi:hypothetical protein